MVEGAGGIMVPVFQDFLVRDLIKLLNLPLVIVARPNLGTINHTLLTIEAAKKSGIEIIGVVISDYPLNTDDLAIKTAPNMIEELSGVKILGILPEISCTHGYPDRPESLIDVVLNYIDIQKIFNLKIPKLLDEL